MPDIPDKYHVTIAGQNVVLEPGGYAKMPAPTFGARVSGGDPSFNNLSTWQHWVQHCWAGGLGAEDWVDDSMYDEGVGCDTTVHERLHLSRDLSRPTGGALNAGSLDNKRKFYIFNATLYCLTIPTSGSTTSYLWQWTASTATWAVIKTWTNWSARCIYGWNGSLAVGGQGGTIYTATDPTSTWTERTPPDGVTDTVFSMAGYKGGTEGGQRLYVAYGYRIYRRKPDWSIDGSTAFYEASTADSIRHFRSHLGFLWFASNNGQIFRTDSNNTFDIWHFDGHTTISSMQSYDGKLFVATFEYTDTADIGQGVLYQMTGSAMTQLKRWGNFDKATTIGGMLVYDRKLYYGASGLWGMNKNAAGTDLGGFGVAVYDAIEDSHSIWATNKDTTTWADASGVGRDWMVDDVVFFGGYLHAAVRKHGNFRTPLAYRDYLRASAKYDTTSTAATGTASQGFIQSSDYDGGTPGLLKLWQQILLQADLPATSTAVRVYYSLDRGGTWSSAHVMSRVLTGTCATGAASTEVVGTSTAFIREVMPGDSIAFGAQVRTVESVQDNTHLTLTAVAGATSTGEFMVHQKTRLTYAFRLNNVRSPRFMYRLELDTGADTVSPVVRGISVSYLPQPEPNWVWKLSFVVAHTQKLRDLTVETVDTEAVIDLFSTAYRMHLPITFTDIDGTQWEVNGQPGVLMTEFQFVMHVPGYSGDPIEGRVSMTLLEVAESY
jgi:hypothetical protein